MPTYLALTYPPLLFTLRSLPTCVFFLSVPRAFLINFGAPHTQPAGKTLRPPEAFTGLPAFPSVRRNWSSFILHSVPSSFLLLQGVLLLFCPFSLPSCGWPLVGCLLSFLRLAFGWMCMAYMPCMAYGGLTWMTWNGPHASKPEEYVRSLDAIPSACQLAADTLCRLFWDPARDPGFALPFAQQRRWAAARAGRAGGLRG